MRSAAPFVAAVLLDALAHAAQLPAQTSAVGLSSVRARQFDNENLIFFQPYSGDHFAWTLAAGDFNGDGVDDLATGIPDDDGMAGFEIADCGAVVVRYGAAHDGFDASLADAWVSQISGGAPDPAQAGDKFGAALAACNFDGDAYEDLAVGIPYEDGPDDEVDSGAVQIHYGSVNGIATSAAEFLNQATDGVAGDPESGDRFGYSLACGDFNEDGFSDLAVGVPWETFEDFIGDFITYGGMINVFYGSADGFGEGGRASFHQDTDGVDGDAETGDYFGRALASGDFNGDGFADLAIGVPGEDNPISIVHGRGAVEILFGGESGLTSANDILRTENSLGGVSEDDDELGSALAAGDFDGDQFDDLAIGIPFESFDGQTIPIAGQFAAIYGAETGFDFARTQFWFEDRIFGSGATETNDHFAQALAVGDFDRDGKADLAIGVPGETQFAQNDGAVDLLMGSPTGLNAARYRTFVEGHDGIPGRPDQPGRAFGHTLACGDFDHDGHADLAIGAPLESVGTHTFTGAEDVLYGSLFSDGLETQGFQLWSGALP